ncbi:hypothetical protein HYT32_01410 [Candidatus Roizmanbacteria bacterium]|nr:hypothetical protein [Candidatus Roizmanbacteria bacterium]
MANTLGRSVRRRSRPKQYANQSILETLRSIPTGVAQSLGDSAKKTVDAKQWETYLGFNDAEQKKRKFEGDLTPGQELDLRSLQNKDEEENRILDRDPGIDYHRQIRDVEKTASHALSQETRNNIQQILIELKKIVDTTKELQTQFKEVAVVQTVVNPGKYHESFFEWMLSIVRNARMKVEDSGAWVAAMQGKNSKKSYYWANSNEKVGGTSFQLSSERVVATQVG